MAGAPSLMLAAVGAVVPLLLWPAPLMDEDRVSAKRVRSLFRVIQLDGQDGVTVSMPWDGRELVFSAGEQELGRLGMSSELPGGVAVIGSNVMVSSFSVAENRGQLILVSLDGGEPEELVRIRLDDVDPWQVCHSNGVLYIWDFKSRRVVPVSVRGTPGQWEPAIRAAMKPGASYRFGASLPFGEAGNYDECDYDLRSVTSGDGFSLAARAAGLRGLATFRVWPELGGWVTRTHQSRQPTPAALARQAEVAEARRRLDDAERLWWRAVGSAEERYGRESAKCAWNRGRLGKFLGRHGKSKEALAMLTDASLTLAAKGHFSEARFFGRDARVLAMALQGMDVKSTPFGCLGIASGAFTKSPGVEIVSDNFSISSGSCSDQERLSCVLRGSYTITNCNDRPIYVQHVMNGKPLMGKTMIAAKGKYQISYEGDTVRCGDKVEVRIYEANPSRSKTPVPVAAGWSFECTSCKD